VDTRATLISMLKHLLEDSVTLNQQGSGYFSCIPIIHRYNKLLGVARSLFPEGNGIIATFDEHEPRDPKDPADKMKVIQGIRVEAGQLVSLLESTREEGAADA
jgi:hypothetical protein